MRDYEYMRLTMESARSEYAGKPLQNNTRLFHKEVMVEGVLTDAYVVRLHATDIVAILPDNRAMLFNGGWRTNTTLDRIRTYGSSHVYSEDSEWYVQLSPDPDDPRPERYDRTLLKPYDEPTDPGPEPVKTVKGAIIYGDQEIVFPKAVMGCRAGTTEEYSYEERVYEWALTDEEKHKGYPVGDRGDRIIMRNGTIKWTEYSTWTTGEQQCKHCNQFDQLKSKWYQMENGGWGRNTGKGHKTWRKSMERFGTVEAWQEAYLDDFRKRRAYLKALREWIERNRVSFYDGIIVDSDGYAKRPSKSFTKRLEAHERKVEKLKKRIDKYVDGFIDALKKGMPMPSGGDCWYCSMVTTDEHTGQRKPWGDAMQTLHPDGSLTVEPSSGHLHEHMRDRYYVPSLAVNALREKGYQDVGIYLHLDMNPDAQMMGKEDGRYDTVKRDIRSYMRKRLIPQAPTK